jgi:hypothetical protein
MPGFFFFRQFERISDAPMKCHGLGLKGMMKNGLG